MYKLIEDYVWGGATTAVKDKVNVGVKLNFKSYNIVGNVKQEKCVKFNKDVMVFRARV